MGRNDLFPPRGFFMAADLRAAIQHTLAALPSREQIHRRIAENLQERRLLREVLKLIDRREQAAARSEVRGRA
jgi:hypothetical protein